jgi:ParB family chromosome partitioning protein
MTEPRTIKSLSLDEIVITDGRRQLQEDKANHLAAGMKLIGLLLQPISVRLQDSKYHLVDGLHRLTAARSLGWQGDRLRDHRG